ncbi:hypothetical protein H7I53_20355 [Mycolicibacterium pulveris]|uniref:Uncharacterized protein n=1 Tax=Mycolicibacterium pulveris TaxID=36813 RepID=A0A7I7UQN2_MYCPV|nr:hypothetical protein [Mycolicibacterium pulveris]MCV6982566.1 hypothetical protein [Mycolicibacterium pulveris]BBY83775.1 hypothetical protein MPUL_49330 [Mycolicibacterium pulveris]
MDSRSIGVTALAGAVLLLPGCGSSGETESTVTVTEPAPTATASPTATAPQTGAPAPVPQTGPAAPARPARDQCVRVEPAPDGRYQVFDAGSAVVTFADGRLTLESVTPADGWTHRVDDQEPEEVEIAFRRGGEELDLEVEIDDGRLEVSICNDDD